MRHTLPGLQRWLPALALLVLSCTWGYTWVLVKQALEYASPFSLAAQRAVGGALALVLAVRLTGRSMALVAPGTTLLLGLIQVSGFTILQTSALVEGGPGKTSVLIFTMPIWTLLMSWPLLGERVQVRQWLAALSTLGGLLLMEFAPGQPTAWTPDYLLMLTFLSVASVAMCWWLWGWILSRVPAWEASLSVLGTPVVAILSSRLTLGEAFKLSEVAGILLIGGGLALLSLFGWLASRRSEAGG